MSIIGFVMAPVSLLLTFTLAAPDMSCSFRLAGTELVLAVCSSRYTGAVCPRLAYSALTGHGQVRFHWLVLWDELTWWRDVDDRGFK